MLWRTMFPGVSVHNRQSSIDNSNDNLQFELHASSLK